MNTPDEAVQAALAHYSEGGCMGLDEHERREVTIDMLTAALPFLAGVKVNSAKIETMGRYEARYFEDIPTDCCDYGVVDISAGIEVCRVWKEEEARRIAELLNGCPAALRPLPTPPGASE